MIATFEHSRKNPNYYDSPIVIDIGPLEQVVTITPTTYESKFKMEKKKDNIPFWKKFEKKNKGKR